MRLLWACVALAWLMFCTGVACFGCCCASFCVLLLFRWWFHALALGLLCACLAPVLRWLGLLRLLLRLFVRPAAVSLPVLCACCLLMLRLPGCCFALVWLLLCAGLACFGCCCACSSVLLLFRCLFHAFARCLYCACLVVIARWLG